jgi:hypothetical protein
MPGVATAQLLTYSQIVDVDLDATNDVNFADVEDYGHRVIVEMNTAAMNNYLSWYRNIGSARPAAKLNTAYEAAFKAAIEAAMGAGFVDIDGVTGGLHFGTANLSTNPDPRIRKDGAVSANDIPLCFILYKMYGSSSVATLDNIYNMADAYEMLGNTTVATAIAESFKAEEAGALDIMFRDLLAADPHRFFDASGLPIMGMFESNVDVAGSGTWKLVADDTLEVKLKMIFHSRVSRRGVAGQEHNMSSTAAENNAASQANQQTVINPDDYFYIRLQLKSTPDADAGTIGGGGAGGGINLTQDLVFEDSFTGTNTNSLSGYDGANLSTNKPGTSGFSYSVSSSAGLYATIPSVSTNTLTICASLYYTGTSAGDWQGIVLTRSDDNVTNRASGLHIHNNNLGFHWNDNVTSDSTIQLPDSTWTHVVVQLGPTSAAFYINGVLQETVGGFFPAVTFTKFNLGLDPVFGPGGRYFRGLIDNLRIYTRELTQPEITQIYNQTLA